MEDKREFPGDTATTSSEYTSTTNVKFRRSNNIGRWTLVLLAASSFLATWTLHPFLWRSPVVGSQTQAKTTDAVFDWDKLSAKPYLDYAPCYEDEFQCARLELPMDWFNGTTDAKIGLALIKKPAVVPVTHDQYGGAVLTNPGGPGGSGVGQVRNSADKLRGIMDSKDGKYFDIISFDPRGVANTQPRMLCSSSPRLDESWHVRIMEEGVFSGSDAAFGRLWSMAVARAGGCSIPLSTAEAEIKKYMTTASVARDMVEIVEKHGEWRENEAKRLLQQQRTCRKLPAMSVPEALKYKPTQEKIQYWGFSYGTYLGNTFAAMFPERVGRLIVDGVVDAYDYKKALWSDNLSDTEKDMDQFYFHCARVGYPRCALANASGETTSEGVKARLLNITSQLYHNPLPVVSTDPEVITYSDVKNLIFASLYKPIGGFTYMANLLADVERGNGTEFSKLLKPYHEFSCPAQPGSGFSIVPLRNISKGASMSYEATMGIACSDGDDQSSTTKAEFAKHVQALSNVSSSIGEMWSTVRLHCIHYSVHPVYRFEGPWVANTSHPILEIGNTADPVTPVRFAKKMASGFPGAGVLVQNSAGHCSISAASKCTEGYIRQYFQTGELPPEGTVCEVDELPFGPGLDETTSQIAESLVASRKADDFAVTLRATGNNLRSGNLAPVFANLL